jgi:hypothetical protein
VWKAQDIVIAKFNHKSGIRVRRYANQLVVNVKVELIAESYKFAHGEYVAGDRVKLVGIFDINIVRRSSSGVDKGCR